MSEEKAQMENEKRIYDEWKSLSEKISEAHKVRNQSVKQFLLSGIRLYEELLVSTTVAREFHIQNIHQYEVLPLNGEERYHFISSRPEHYSSYIQLNELFNETKKKIARLRIQSKK